MANKNSSRIIGQNISYHDQAATSYDSVMHKDSANKEVRQKVKEKFTSLLPSGRVLDFGGGTGLDLEWLTAGGYTIFFCEPSVPMRKKAISYNDRILHYKDILFLEDDEADFISWQEKTPFPQKVDAILSNFGPLNYIPDIELLFRNMAGVIRPGGHFVMLILEFSFSKKLKWHRRSLIFGKPFVMYIPYEESREQTVFVYSIKEIRKASAGYFNYCGHESIPGFGFALVHLVRTEAGIKTVLQR
jgi:SAM-dependent methyltransferase